MTRINLLSVEHKVVVKEAAAPSSDRLMAIGAAFILLVSVGFLGWRYWALGEESRQLEAQIAMAQEETTQLQSVIAQVAQFEQRRVQLQERVTLIEQLRSNQTGPVHMLDQISRALPPMVWLTELKQTAEANEVVIAGRSTVATGLPDFVGSLEASGYFTKSVEIVSTTSEPLPTPPGDLVTFEIKATFQPPARPRPGAEATTTAATKSEN
jgi:type IV pilus assembly protein PilN